MKLSISLPDEDLAFVDEYAQRTRSPSRSSVIHRALNLLRLSDLEEAYASAWDEWDSSEDSELWNKTSADGISDAAR